MTLQQLIEQSGFTVLNAGTHPETVLTKPFTCDLLSVCMSKASAQSVWVTVMGNVNAIAVAVLTDVACIVLAEHTELDAIALEKAKQQGVTVLQTELPIFDAALHVHTLIHA